MITKNSVVKIQNFDPLSQTLYKEHRNLKKNTPKGKFKVQSNK